MTKLPASSLACLCETAMANPQPLPSGVHPSSSPVPRSLG